MRCERCDTSLHCTTDMGNVVYDPLLVYVLINLCHGVSVTAVNVAWRKAHVYAGVIQADRP